MQGVAEMQSGMQDANAGRELQECRKGTQELQNAGIAECRNCRMHELHNAGIAEMQKFRNYINIEMHTCRNADMHTQMLHNAKMIYIVITEIHKISKEITGMQQGNAGR
jgi:hypothetical protein